MSTEPQLGLQPSAAKRWTRCTASPRYIAENQDKIPPETVESWTQEGIDAHNYAEALLKGQTVAVPDPETHAAVTEYVEFVRSKVTPHSALFVEIKVPLPYQPGRNGKVDSVIVTPPMDGKPGIIDVTDYKHGVGVSVEAVENEQMAIYAVGAVNYLLDAGIYDEFADDTLCRLVIVQPRARDGRTFRQWNVSLRDLVDWYEKNIARVAVDILNGERNEFAPSEDAYCSSFCPARTFCTARAKFLLGDLPAEIKAPVEAVLTLPDVNSMSPETVAKLLQIEKPLVKFFEQNRQRAYTLIENGTTVPGHKIVPGKKARGWKDEAEAKRVLRQKFEAEQVVETSVISPAKAEKLIKGREDLSTRWLNLVEAQIEVKEGKPTLVEESDPRPALTFKPEAEFASLDQSSAGADASLE